MLKKFFSGAEVNTHRQIEIDFVKSILITLMILTHCFEYLSTPAVQEGNWYYFVVTVVNNFLGGGACAYMMCMGIGIAYSRKSIPEEFIKRGVLLFLAGYALNAARFGIPSFLFFLAGRISFSDVASDLLATDIMQFAGLAMILFAGLREHLALNNVPKAFRGLPIALITVSIMAMAFLGFSGIV